jgi:flagellar biosynthesis/type III secretory pathway M-ring protein FliF/YscJ
MTTILLVAFFALFGILRPLSRRALGVATTPALPAAGPTAKLPTVREMEGRMDAPAGAPGSQARLPVLTQRVVKLASDEPEQLARIVRGWIAEGER